MEDQSQIDPFPNPCASAPTPATPTPQPSTSQFSGGDLEGWLEKRRGLIDASTEDLGYSNNPDDKRGKHGKTGRPKGKHCTPEERYNPKSISHRHEAIIDFMLANPTATNISIARAFDVTPVWIGLLTRSEAFREAFDAKSKVAFDDVVVPLRRKMYAVADTAYERLGECVHKLCDPEVLLAIADKTSHRLGFAPNKGQAPGAVPIQSTTVIVGGDAVAVARELLQSQMKANSLPQPVPALEGTSNEE